MADGDLGGGLDEALETAHLPALLASLVHITGDPDWLRPEWTPVYVPLSRGDPGLPAEVQADIRARAKTAIQAYLANRQLKLQTPDRPTLRRMMDFVAGRRSPRRTPTSCSMSSPSPASRVRTLISNSRRSRLPPES